MEELSAQALEDRILSFKRQCTHFEGKFGRIRLSLNPVTTALSTIAIWALIIWIIVDEGNSKEYLTISQTWISNVWTWLYVVAQTAWVFLVFIILFKFGHIKLGLENEKPEYNDYTYFAMIFTTGVCEIFYSCVSDPITLYNDIENNGVNFWGRNTSSHRAQNAINLTMFHWGFHGYSAYVIPTLLLAILTLRKGLPLTLRTCLYPLFGNNIFGRLGDFIDTVSIICVIFGVGVSLTLSAQLMNSGISKLSQDQVEFSVNNQVIIIWVMTVFAAVSLVSGINLGIRRLSEICLSASLYIVVLITLCDDTWFIMRLFVQSVGYYLQHFLGTSFYTSAFEGARNLSSEESKNSKWLYENTNFYWGWWISWAPLATVFTVRISKGRTIREVIIYSFLLPSLFLSYWIVTFGGIGINMENRALKAGHECEMYENSNGLNNVPGPTLLSCRGSSERYFDILNQYDDIGIPLDVLSLITIAFFFITSSDSTSLVVDIVASNGKENTPVFQRTFWALTCGAASTALAKSKIEGIVVVVTMGLPFALYISLCCLSLWRVLKKEPKWCLDLDGSWKMMYGKVNNLPLVKKACILTICPWYGIGNLLIFENQYQKLWKKYVLYIVFSIIFYFWIATLILSIWFNYASYFGWVCLVGLLIFTAQIRRRLRKRHGIDGNSVEDLLTLLLYPLALLQMEEELLVEKHKNENEALGSPTSVSRRFYRQQSGSGSNGHTNVGFDEFNENGNTMNRNSIEEDECVLTSLPRRYLQQRMIAMEVSGARQEAHIMNEIVDENVNQIENEDSDFSV